MSIESRKTDAFRTDSACRVLYKIASMDTLITDWNYSRSFPFQYRSKNR